MTKVVVTAMFVLAAAAAGDALRGPGSERPAREYRSEAPSRGGVDLVQGITQDFASDGSFLHKRVLRAGKEYLSAEAIERAFPVPVDGPLDISKLAVAPDGTLVLAVYRFPADGHARGALEFWRGRRLVGAFAVPPGSFGRGLAFNRDGSRVATFSYDRRLSGVFDRHGRRFSSFSDSSADGG